MNKTVFGVYDTASATMKAIDSLKAKGYRGKNITVIADKEERLDNLEESDSVHGDVKAITDIGGKSTFADKLLRFFYDRDPDISGKLKSFGLSDNETAAYMKDVQKGKILVLLDLNSDKQPFEARFDNGSPAIHAMERYNSGLGMVEQPVTNSIPGRNHSRGEIEQDWSENTSVKNKAIDDQD